MFDIGGTHIRRGVLEGGHFLLLDKHNSTNLAATLEHLVDSSLRAHPAIGRVGISFAGQVRSGVIDSAPNITLGELSGKSVPEWALNRFGLPAAIDNDLKCAARAEATCFPEAKALAVLYIGTGFGGALIQNGQIVSGSTNQAGEIGHIPFEQAPFACGCGKDNCLELSTSGGALRRWSQHLGLGDQNLTTITAFRHTEPKAEEILGRFLRGFRHALQSITPIFNPDQIVLGGGVILGNPWLLPIAKEAVCSAFEPVSHARVALSTLGDEANLIGAAKLFERVEK